MAKSDRAQPSDAIQRVSPSFLQRFAETDKSLASMAAHEVVPRTKLIQSMTDDALKSAFGEGSLIIRPGDTLVAKRDEMFLFVPKFFFADYTKVADRRDKDTQMIVERTFDPTSVIAKRSQNTNTRFELYPGHEKLDPKKQFYFRYVESLNFVGDVFEHPEFGTVETTVSFQRGELFQGRSFISAIRMRRSEAEDGTKFPTPLWAQVWALTPRLRDKPDRKWYGLDFTPGEPSIIREELADSYQQRHIELAKAHEERRLVVDGAGDNDDDDAAVPGAASEM